MTPNHHTAADQAAADEAAPEQPAAIAPIEEEAPAEGPQPDRQRTARWPLAGLAAVVLLIAGSVGGYLLHDPESTDAYRSLASDKAAAAADRNRLQSDLTTLSSKYSDLRGGIQDREDKVAQREDDVSAAESKVKDAEAAVKKREDAVSGAEKEKAANTAREGVWIVGKDIDPGTYRANSEVSSRCYWEITQSGSNGENIIQNDMPGGGRPSVSLADGQDFKSNNCGTWTKE